MAGMAAASTIISVISAVASTANSYANYQAQVKAANTNAEISDNNARMTGIASSYAQDKKLQEGKQYISGQYVSNLQSGAAGAGTTGDRAVAKSMYNLDKDLNMLAYNYSTKATDFLNQSKMFRYEADVAKANAANTLISGGLNVGNSLLAKANVKSDAGVSELAKEYSRPMYSRNSKLWL